ncbi:hypothetical protein DFP72DRAFT_865140 [Ephemerocybe angulata]|uniref:Uncharacterized protein n=1 Tax=Ephemerocybe angulata TaxID=980116 RepID=A0A8H6IJA5_9AGAR|nr:hypothetical protein DFP72DRAFT_865140 [Tulosesus angulatus]
MSSTSHSFRSLLGALLVALFAATFAHAAHGGVLDASGLSPTKFHHGKRNVLKNRMGTEVARRAEGTLAKRFGNARFTYFVTGMGACGNFNTPEDFIVAINTPQWDGGSHCGKTVTINLRGKTAQATVADRCVECPPNALDFTEGLMRYFDSNYRNDGTLYGEWSFGDSAPEQPKPTSTTEKPKPTSTTTTTTSTSTSTSTSTTTSSTTTSTSSKTTSTTTSTSATTTSTAALATSSSAAATPTGGFLDQAAYVLVELGNVVAHAPTSIAK